ncbi:MAG: AAA family ATPase [Gammaproteobacteria bacterium]|nr:AAA family ATPase [Gammaproteobacteria bacterium]MDH5652781.1 AAA family ATPase [Gammaproteobacteria bacterium]
MYLEHYGLKDFPFGLASDPKFLYLSKAHARVKAQIEYALYIQDSLVVFTGEIGSGKTTLLQDALNNFGHNMVVAKLHQTQINEVEFLQLLLVEFGFQLFDAAKVELLEKISSFLKQQYKQGKKVVLIVDEAQNLSKKVLEEIRLLSDLQNGNSKLMTVIIVGQPELNELLDAPGMEQMVQRIRLRFHINALTEEEITEYIRHRLSVANAPNVEMFEPETVPMIYVYTGGRPRLMNILCDYALMCGAIEEVQSITTDIIQQAVEELNWEPYEQRFSRRASGRTLNVPSDTSTDDIARLVVSKDGRFVAEFKLNKEYFSIGRKPDNDFMIDDKKVSRYHAQIVTNNGISHLRDLDSTNGTFIGTEPVESQPLLDGEVFTIADVSFQYLKSPDLEDTSEEEYGKILEYRNPNAGKPSRRNKS